MKREGSSVQREREREEKKTGALFRGRLRRKERNGRLFLAERGQEAR